MGYHYIGHSRDKACLEDELERPIECKTTKNEWGVDVRNLKIVVRFYNDATKQPIARAPKMDFGEYR